MGVRIETVGELDRECVTLIDTARSILGVGPTGGEEIGTGVEIPDGFLRLIQYGTSAGRMAGHTVLWGGHYRVGAVSERGRVYVEGTDGEGFEISRVNAGRQGFTKLEPRKGIVTKNPSPRPEDGIFDNTTRSYSVTDEQCREIGGRMLSDLRVLIDQARG